MRKSAYLLSLVTLLGTGLTACQPSYLLQENFSGDVIGQLPKRSVAGAPDGDSVVYRTVLGPRLSIQPFSAKSTHKALVFSEAPYNQSSVFDGYLAFKGIASDYSKAIQFQWTGQQRNSVGTLMIDVMGPQGLWVTRLFLQPNGQLVRVINIPKNTTEVLGTLDAAQPHSVFITMNAEDPKKPKNQPRTFNIIIFNTKEGNDSNRQNLPVLNNPEQSSPVLAFDKLMLSFSYQHEGINPESAYVFESVYIAKP